MRTDLSPLPRAEHYNLILTSLASSVCTALSFGVDPALRQRNVHRGDSNSFASYDAVTHVVSNTVRAEQQVQDRRPQCTTRHLLGVLGIAYRRAGSGRINSKSVERFLGVRVLRLHLARDPADPDPKGLSVPPSSAVANDYSCSQLPRISSDVRLQLVQQQGIDRRCFNKIPR